MNQRVMNIVALVAVTGVAAGGAVVYMAGRLNPPPVSDIPANTFEPSTSPSAPPAPPRAEGVAGYDALREDVTSTSGKALDGPTTRRSAPIRKTEPAQLSPPQRVYTWAEMEEKLDRIRASRDTSPAYWSDLASAYEELSRPTATGSKEYPEHIKKLSEWRREFPHSPSPLVVEARSYIQYAWDARGIGLANSVSEVGWELYGQRIEEAHRLLIESLNLGAKDGEVYSQLVQVAKAASLPLERAHEWVEEGRELDPTYFTLYQSMAEYLLPRWHGQPGDVERFAADLVEQLPGDDGLVAYALVALKVTYYDYIDYLSLFRARYDRELLTKAGEALVKRHPQWREGASFAAVCTVATQDHAVARRIRPLVGDLEPVDRLWLGGNTHREFLDWSARESIPGGEVDWIWGTHYEYGGIGFAPNARYIWCGQGGFHGRAAALLDLMTNGVRGILIGPDGYLNDLVFDSGHNWVLASFGHGNDDKFTGIVLWDASTFEVLAQQKTTKRCDSIAINPVLSQVAWCEFGSVHVYDLSMNSVRRIDLRDRTTRVLRYSPDGNLLFSETVPISVWDAKTGEHLRDLPSGLENPPSELWCEQILDIDREGRCLVVAMPSPLVVKQDSAPRKKVVARLSPDMKTWETLIPDLWQHGSVVTHAAAVSPNRRWLAIPQQAASRSAPQRIDIWDLQTGLRRTSFGGHWNSLGQVAFSGDSRQLASIARTGGPIKIWSLESLESD